MTFLWEGDILKKMEGGRAVYLEGRELQGMTGREAGRALLRDMYHRYVGEEMPPILLTDRGKPYFLDSPWHFSISHSKGHVFCALSRKNIGIDAEELDRNVSPKLAEKILSPMEQQQYEHAEDKRLALLRFWVLKEAQAKMTGEGIKFHPVHTEFSLSDPRVRELQNCLVAVIEEEDHVI